MGSEFEKAGWEPGGEKMTFSKTQFIDYVVSKASDEAEKRIVQKHIQQSSADRWIAVVLSLIVIGAVSAVTYFATQFIAIRQQAKIASAVSEALKASEINNTAITNEAVQRAVDRAVRDKFDAKIAGLAARLDAMLTYQRLLALTTQLELKDSFSNEDREQVLKILSKIKTSVQSQDRPGFDRTLTKIVDSFTSAYQVAAIDRLDDMFRQELASLKDVPRWMTNHFGRALVTSRQVNDRGSKRWERLRFYSEVTKQNRNPEISLIWNLLSEFVIGFERKSPELDTLVSNIGNLNEKDREIFMRALLDEGTASQSEPPDMRQLAQIVTKFINTYKKELASFGLATE